VCSDTVTVYTATVVGWSMTTSVQHYIVQYCLSGVAGDSTGEGEEDGEALRGVRDEVQAARR